MRYKQKEIGGIQKQEIGTDGTRKSKRTYEDF
jgi:hypothetical protein